MNILYARWAFSLVALPVSQLFDTNSNSTYTMISDNLCDLNGATSDDVISSYNGAYNNIYGSVTNNIYNFNIRDGVDAINRDCK